MYLQMTLLDEVKKKLHPCDDLTTRTFPELNIIILYFDHLVGTQELEQDVLQPLSKISESEVMDVLNRFQYQEAKDTKTIIKGILAGNAAIFYKRKNIYLINLYTPKTRDISAAQIETSIVGPREAFVESIEMNLSCIRRRIQSEKLKVLNLQVGYVTNTKMNVIYIEGITPDHHISDVREKINSIEVDGLHDLNMLMEYIDENPFSLFPQYLTTERPDVVASKLLEGKVVGLFDGSPYAFCAPTTFWEHFQSPDDYNQRWILGTASRFLRYIALFITLTFTALYVSITMFHYEMIPNDLLLSLIESRAKVPFQPIYEALLMEFTIELLREAGARLPTKIGQTIGIVGGIVIGTAAVQAGFTSNILIVIVAISAMASYVVPHIIMSASIRLARFGLIFLAGILGNFGLIAGVTLIVIQISKLTSLHSSYVIPTAPFSDWKDTFIRAPLKMIKNKPSQTKEK
ncbi:spore germination protein [Halalkalibacter okhensis]|uniref:Spore gernimation protein GerA n=1 Tax=Halalkalibacter okhensis TaxID=333138 RepID=A0A0B0IPF2_9BACI|nr:spore germination protein [Halalkalibacter okhensis]KHF41561.1 spore gernimation protein GerA [Halalkalibacter okhensis]